LAARENLDNLVWVINCNLQRLDGPVRGNGKIIQELEAVFQGAGWNVIKVIWGSDWDKLLAADKTGLLLKRMEEAVDGDYQKYSVEPGSYTRKHFFGKYPELLQLVNHLSDEQINKLLRGGHDSRKVYAAYKSAIDVGAFETKLRDNAIARLNNALKAPLGQPPLAPLDELAQFFNAFFDNRHARRKSQSAPHFLGRKIGFKYPAHRIGWNAGTVVRDGDFDGAIADYTKAIELNPQYAKAYTNRTAVEALKKAMK
jgi:tetratricopeptide (TPR) repeat protein